MKTRSMAFTLTLLAALAATSALASGGGYTLDWFTVDGGGGTSSGGGIVVEGAIGQPEAGEMSGGGITVVGGFYSEDDSAPAGTGILFLPLVLKNYPPCFAGPNEVEPNDDFPQANGPLCVGVTDFTGYHNGATEDKDYFQFTLATAGTITVQLVTYANTDPQIALYNQSQVSVGFSGGPPYSIVYNGAAGTYYARVYTTANYGANAYTLRVTYP